VHDVVAGRDLPALFAAHRIGAIAGDATGVAKCHTT
jgi:hypothetical protein